MIVLSWILMIVSGLFILISFLNMLIKDSGKKRFLSLVDLIFFIITFITALSDIIWR